MGLNDKQKEILRRNNYKRKEKILKATNNGQCWWIYQQLINRTKYTDEENW